jgi:hypothetical protein
VAENPLDRALPMLEMVKSVAGRLPTLVPPVLGMVEGGKLLSLELE